MLLGHTNTSAALDVKASVDIGHVEFSLGTSGKIGINIPRLKVRLLGLGIAFLFLPYMRLSSLEVGTEPTKLEVNLLDTKIVYADMERATQLQVITSGEIRVSTV